MRHYEKQINFLKELGAKKEFFYNITLTRNCIKLQGELSRDSKAAIEQYVVLNFDNQNDWLKGKSCIDEINIEVILTF